MSEIAIKVENLGKRYRIGEAVGRGNGWRSLIEKGVSPFRYLASTLREPSEDEIIWALNDVSFEVKQGEVLGIIGPNGAGKSTLLKILSRITEPTEGKAFLNGRVGSLLEVGTGFHPELTGRENIYLNGAILGMRKWEIRAKFDEIVSFAEIEKFIDTPVKRYSSGMYVRLAFAVAAHLDPEILVVDEVLAVGDAAFQSKCLGKMGSAAHQGRTVLFVSHNMAAIENLCSRALLLNEGKIEITGSPDAVINSYLRRNLSHKSLENGVLANGPNGTLQILSFDISDVSSSQSGLVRWGQELSVAISVRVLQELTRATLVIAIKDMKDTRIAVLNSTMAGYAFDLVEGIHMVRCKVPAFPLSPGVYQIEMKILSGQEQVLYEPTMAQLTVVDGDFYGSGKTPDPRWGGLCHLRQKWDLDQHEPKFRDNLVSSHHHDIEKEGIVTAS